MLRMRLTRVGSKKRPHYRVIVADSRAPRDGRHVDIVGHYHPLTAPATVEIDVERAVKWLRNGAQPSDRVRILLRHSGVLKAHEEARLADKRQHKEDTASAPAKAVRKATDAAEKTAKVAMQAMRIVTRGVRKVAAVAEDAAGDAAEAVAGALPGGRGAAKSAGKTASKPAAKTASKSAAKSGAKSAAKSGSKSAAKSSKRS